MPTMQCPGCGKAVRFEGVAGVCPNCAAVVRAPRATPTAAGAGAASGRAAKAPASSASLSDLQSLGEGSTEEVFRPRDGGGQAGGGGFGAGLASLDPRLLYGIGGALVLIVAFGLYEVLHTPTPTIAVVTTPPAQLPAGTSLPTPPTIPVVPPPIVVVPTVPTAAVATTGPAATQPAWVGLHPAVPVLPPEKITDEKVEVALRRGVGFLKPLVQAAGENPVPTGVPNQEVGSDALATYALLHAGEAIDDTELKSSSPLMVAALDRIKSRTPNPSYSTYAYSLRAQALGLAGRDADHGQLVKDQQWLLKDGPTGAFAYNDTDPLVQWDNSNSQYGVLGIWAASEAGVPAPGKFWQDVERHWVSNQGKDGGWSYTPNGGSTVTMTAAGLTSLCVAAEQDVLDVGGPGHRAVAGGGNGAGGNGAAARARANGPAPAPSAPVTPAALTGAIDQGLAYLSKGDVILGSDLDVGYTLYGVERAALATGFRFFGAHDWYRELGARQLADQSPVDGSWGDRWGPGVGTSFNLLFLARGRQPLLMNKLRFTGNWNDRPRDVARLAAYTSAQLERPFAWGVADLDRDWWDWLDAPLIFITSNQAPEFTDEDCKKLREYADAGGFIFLHNEFATKDFDAFAHDLAKRVFPEYPLAKVGAGDLLYKSVFTLSAAKKAPPLMAVSNGTRPLMVYSPTDISKSWVAWRTHDTKDRPDLQMGLNLFVAAAGKADYRNRLKTPYVDPPQVVALGTVPVQSIRYAGGNCNPEPGGWARFGRWFIDQTSLAVDVLPTDIRAVDIHAGPVAVLTGNEAVDFGRMDLHALGDFVRGGGTLLIDATGGDPGFVKSVREGLLPAAFGGARPTGMPLDHPILAGTGSCMTPLPKPRLRKYATEQLGISNPPGVQYLTYGSGTVVVSDLDVSTALLASGTYGILGYTPDYADGLYKNAVLWTLTRFQPPPPPPPAPADKGGAAAAKP